MTGPPHGGDARNGMVANYPPASVRAFAESLILTARLRKTTGSVSRSRSFIPTITVAFLGKRALLLLDELVAIKTMR